jgi:hypothetical protein
MTIKHLCALLLVFLLLPHSALAEAGLRSYTENEGQAWAVFGVYPAMEDGASLPILWQVLGNDGKKATLLSEAVLDVQPAHQGSAYLGFEQSTLNAWLQEEFAVRAFSAAEHLALIRDDTGRAVTLPSAALLKDRSLGFTRDADRIAPGTAYAISRGLLTYGNMGAGYWISDKAQSMAGAQRRVLGGGVLGYTRADAKNIGVRPLVRLNLERLTGLSGSGSRDDPYTFILDGSPLPTAAPTPLPTSVPTIQPSGSISTEGFPPLTGEGFLPAGEPEYVFIDVESGQWRYASQDLRIIITRQEDKSVPLRWLGAEIFVREGAQPFRMVSHDREHMLEDRTKYLEKPAVIARNNNLVFSMDGDYFIYRIGRAKADGKKYALGVEIRGGDILVDSPPSPSRSLYPPLDMLALFPDGDMRVYKGGELTAGELLALGVQDVLSFGPYLIRGGEINTSYTNYGTTLQPRAAIGMVSRGHYWAVIVEGRIRPSKGMTCLEVAGLMKELDCETAFNLDGGWTSAMVFMGRQLNQLDKSGVHDNARTQNEVMGIGYTDAYLEGRAP